MARKIWIGYQEVIDEGGHGGNAVAEELVAFSTNAKAEKYAALKNAETREKERKDSLPRGFYGYYRVVERELDKEGTDAC